MADDSFFLIDIERILKEKLGAKYKYVPGFLVSYLKRIVHQDELNVFLRESKDKVGVEFLEACMTFLDAKVEVEGMENLPEEGRCTFVCNHPLGGQDGISLGYVLGKKYDGNVRYLVNDLLMNLRGLAPLCIPVNKTGSQSRDFPRMVEAGFKSDNEKDIEYFKEISKKNKKEYTCASLICTYSKTGAWSLYIGNDEVASYTGT